MNPAGYSGTPLWKKLGIRPGAACAVVNEPSGLRELLTSAPEFQYVADHQAVLVLFFTNRVAEMENYLRRMNEHMKGSEVLWVCWFKKSAKLPTELTEDIIRDSALALDLMDVKVCAIDHQWSGLKLVKRKLKRERD